MDFKPHKNVKNNLYKGNNPHFLIKSTFYTEKELQFRKNIGKFRKIEIFKPVLEKMQKLNYSPLRIFHGSKNQKRKMWGKMLEKRENN